MKNERRRREDDCQAARLEEHCSDDESSVETPADVSAVQMPTARRGTRSDSNNGKIATMSPAIPAWRENSGIA